MNPRTLRTPWHFISLIGLLFACSETNDSDAQSEQDDGAASGGTGVGGQEALAAGGMVSVVPTGGTGGGQITTASGGAADGGTASDGSGGASGGSSGGSESISTGGNASEGAGGSLVDASGGAPALEEFASDLHELFVHDTCTGVQQSQDDTCTHPQLIEEVLNFGGDANTTYLVTLRVRGLFEPTKLQGGTAPLAEHPYFVVGGTVQAGDYSQWQIEVKEPAEVYTLNHYPQTSHTIYQEDFEAPIVVSGGSQIVIRVTDANDRQIDNGTSGLPDRQQVIEGVTDEYLDGQMLRLDVLSVEVQ
jgi:hypothetical protein